MYTLYGNLINVNIFVKVAMLVTINKMKPSTCIRQQMFTDCTPVA